VEPVQASGGYNFGSSRLHEDLSDILLEMRLRNRVPHMPSPGILFLHRKLGGLYLLLSRLNVSLPVREQVAAYL